MSTQESLFTDRDARRQQLLLRASEAVRKAKTGTCLTPIENALARALRRSSRRVFDAIAVAERKGTAPGSPPLTAVFIRPVGDRCNLSCRYCYQDGIRHLSGHSVMSFDLLEEVLVDLSRTAQFPLSIAWHGGEPLLAGKAFFRRAIDLLQAYFVPGTVQNSVQTNGLLLDDEWFELLGSAGFAVGLSVDGPADLHDDQRIFANGTGTLAFVERAARRAATLGVPLNAICVVGDRHRGRGAEVLEQIDKLGIANCNIQPSFSLEPVPSFVEPEVFVDFTLQFVASWWYRTGTPINVMLIENLLEMMLNRAGSDCVFSGRCSQLLAISHDGDVRPCSRPFVGDYSSFGNASNGLTTIVQSSLALRFREHDLWAQNRAPCSFRDLCNQGCPQHRVDAQGIHAVNGSNVFCGCTNSSGVGYNRIWEAILAGVEHGEFPS